MLGDFASRARQDERRGSRDVERVCAISACTDNIVDRFVGIKFDSDCVGSHGTDRACDLGNGLAFHTKRDKIRADLRGRGLTRHDDIHRFFGFIVSEVSAVDGFGNKWFEHGLFSFDWSRIQV